MTYVSDYAIVDITKGSPSTGKVLVLLDDEETAREIASDLTKRGCQVAVEAFPPPGEHHDLAANSRTTWRPVKVRNSQVPVPRVYPGIIGVDGSSSEAAGPTDQAAAIPVRRRRLTSR